MGDITAIADQLIELQDKEKKRQEASNILKTRGCGKPNTYSNYFFGKNYTGV